MQVCQIFWILDFSPAMVLSCTPHGHLIFLVMLICIFEASIYLCSKDRYVYEKKYIFRLGPPKPESRASVACFGAEPRSRASGPSFGAEPITRAEPPGLAQVWGVVSLLMPSHFQGFSLLAEVRARGYLLLRSCVFKSRCCVLKLVLVALAQFALVACSLYSQTASMFVPVVAPALAPFLTPAFAPVVVLLHFFTCHLQSQVSLM